MQHKFHPYKFPHMKDTYFARRVTFGEILWSFVPNETWLLTILKIEQLALFEQLKCVYYAIKKIFLKPKRKS